MGGEGNIELKGFGSCLVKVKRLAPWEEVLAQMSELGLTA